VCVCVCDCVFVCVCVCLCVFVCVCMYVSVSAFVYVLYQLMALRASISVRQYNGTRAWVKLSPEFPSPPPVSLFPKHPLLCEYPRAEARLRQGSPRKHS
jgi:hypothetical protein